MVKTCFRKMRILQLIVLVSVATVIAIPYVFSYIQHMKIQIMDNFFGEYMIIARSNGGLYTIEGPRLDDCKPFYWHISSSGVSSQSIGAATLTNRNTLVGIASLRGMKRQTLAEVDLVSGNSVLSDVNFAWCKSVVYSSTNVIVAASEGMLMLDYPGETTFAVDKEHLYFPTGNERELYTWFSNKGLLRIALSDKGIIIKEKWRWSVPTGIDFVISKGFLSKRVYCGTSEYLRLLAVVRRGQKKNVGKEDSEIEKDEAE